MTRGSVLVCGAQSPFVTGGAELLVRELVEQLRRRGFRVDSVALPFHAHPPSEVIRQALAWRLLELRETDGRRPDLVIATKWPSYLVRHPRKVVWLFHQYREAYDLLGSGHSPLGESEEDRRLIEDVRAMDAAGLGESSRLFTISANVASRLGRFNGLAAQALHPPPPLVGRYRSEAYGEDFLWAGRLEPVKRPALALQALALAGGGRLRIAGRGPLEPELRRLAATLGVQDRVDFLGFVAEEDLLGLLARCRAVVYTPVDEDYGYLPVEGFLSGRPTLTTLDSGGPLEFVEDGVSGLVRAAQPAPLAEAMARLLEMPQPRLRALGEAGRARVAGISWDTVIDVLTESLR